MTSHDSQANPLKRMEMYCHVMQAPGGFLALEVGAGTGGFTRQVDTLAQCRSPSLVTCYTSAHSKEGDYW